MLPKAVRLRTLTTLREKRIKIGAKVVRHARQIIFQMVKVVVAETCTASAVYRGG